jgi:SAM-dependent methyltransferase
MSVKSRIPWQAKIAAKTVLSRLSVGYALWSKFGLFRHGKMDQIDYAYGVFKQHYDLVKPSKGFVGLELGPGDTLASALLSQSFGGSASYLIDVRDFAQRDMSFYYSLRRFLSEKNLPARDLESVASVEELLSLCRSRYMTGGVASLRLIPDGSVDFIYSHSVLEHIREAEFLETMRELRRIVRNSGGCSHRIDLQDHLSGALNNLRFSKGLWESNFISQSGFYTNRIRFSEMIEMFKAAQFDAHVVKIDTWRELPTPKQKLAARFRKMSDEDLRVSGFTVLLKPV